MYKTGKFGVLDVKSDSVYKHYIYHDVDVCTKRK